jgi:hypothetical protein
MGHEEKLQSLQFATIRAVDEVAPGGTLAPEPAEALPLDARALAETLAERLDLAVGTSRLELVFERGRLVHVWRHERIGATSLERRSQGETSCEPGSGGGSRPAGRPVRETGRNIRPDEICLDSHSESFSKTCAG